MKNSRETKRSILLSSIQAQAVWLLTAGALLLIFCAIAYSTEDPDSITLPLSLCALYLSAVFGGIAAVRLSGDGLMSGLLTGILSAGILFLISLLPLPVSSMEMPMSFLYNALVIPAAVIGAALGHKRKMTPSARKAKMMKNLR